MPAPTHETLAWINARIDLAAYAQLRILGWQPYEALMHTGMPIDGQDMAIDHRHAFERQPHVKDAIAAALAKTSVADMWNKKTALMKLGEIIRASDSRDSAKVAAIKVANEIAGFGEADLASRALYRTLADYYEAQKAGKAP